MTELIEDCLATFRLTRLLSQDTIPIVAVPREAVLKRGGLLAELVECPWCLSIWVGAAVVLARRWLPGWSAAARLLSGSAVTGLISERSY